MGRSLRHRHKRRQGQRKRDKRIQSALYCVCALFFNTQFFLLVRSLCPSRSLVRGFCVCFLCCFIFWNARSIEKKYSLVTDDTHTLTVTHLRIRYIMLMISEPSFFINALYPTYKISYVHKKKIKWNKKKFITAAE